MAREYKVPLEKITTLSFRGLCERLEAIVEEMTRLNNLLEKRAEKLNLA